VTASDARQDPWLKRGADLGRKDPYIAERELARFIHKIFTLPPGSGLGKPQRDDPSRPGELAEVTTRIRYGGPTEARMDLAVSADLQTWFRRCSLVTLAGTSTRDPFAPRSFFTCEKRLDLSLPGKTGFTLTEYGDLLLWRKFWRIRADLARSRLR